MKMTALIADDEEQLRRHLIKLLEKLWPELDIICEAENGREVLEKFELLQPDIAFLDIKMPGMTGLEAAEEISGRCRIVFITAFNDYAIEAFEQEAIDYILKPVTEERLIKTIERLKKGFKSHNEKGKNYSAAIHQVMSLLEKKEAPETLQWIRAQHGTGIKLIPVSDVLFFKSEDKYTVVKTADGESLIRKSIKDLEDELDPDTFWRIHRSTIVNISMIEKVDRSFTSHYIVKLKGTDQTLSVSRSYTHLFKQM